MRSEEELARAGLSSEPFPLRRPFEELHAENQRLRDDVRAWKRAVYGAGVGAALVTVVFLVGWAT